MDAGASDVFFYGLYMDPEVLRAQGIEPGTPRRAHVDGFALRIGARATLVPSANGCVHGMVYALAPEALRALYAQAGLEAYQPEGVLAWIDDDTPRPALAFRLAQAPGAQERNEDYARRLQAVLARLGFPPDYVASIDGTAAIDGA
jgi:hypothetical protein